MRKSFCIMLLFLVAQVGFAQFDVLGNSAATSDNLDALTINPAGLGIDRGEQTGFMITDPENGDEIYHYFGRFDGFGFRMYGNDEIEYSLGLGGQVTQSLSLGYQWESIKQHKLGLLYRPANYLSLGAAATYDVRSELTDSRLGLALRPFGHRWTVGADIKTPRLENLDDFEAIQDSSSIWGFVEFQPLDGVYISGTADEDGDYVALNLGLNFGIGGGFAGNKSTDEADTQEYGFYTYSQIQETVFKMPKPKDKTYVRMEIRNNMIEEPPFTSPFNFNLNPFADNKKGTQLRWWIDQIDDLTLDPDIDGLIIDMGYISGGFGKIHEMYDALSRFKEAGKEIIVYANWLTNMSFYLISMADEIYLPELGEVDLRGLMIELTYFKGLMDTLDIVAEVEQISPYKSAMDAFLRKDMSPEVRENWGGVFEDIYNQFVEGIAVGRGWTLEETRAVIDDGPYSSGDAVSAGIISGLMYPDEFDEYITDVEDVNVHVKSLDELFRFEDYTHEWTDDDQPKIAMIYAVGGIQSGRSKPGPMGSSVMGDKTIAEAIKKARQDKDIDAIVLRIDSGGGSALASDMMWREIYNTTDLDSSNVKPFIASMSDVAASGGYYIACQADTIVAYPNTITGSIGVISGRFNFSGLKEKIGLTSDKIKFGKHSDFYSGNKLWSEEERAIVRKGIIDTYGTFLNRVAQGREDLDSLGVDAVGLGRIWTGNQALEHKLIDEVGGYYDAVEIAKAAAGIPEDQEVQLVEYPQFKRHFSLFPQPSLKSELEGILPADIVEEFEILDIIPVLEDDKMQLIMPYKITVK